MAQTLAQTSDKLKAFSVKLPINYLLKLFSNNLFQQENDIFKHVNANIPTNTPAGIQRELNLLLRHKYNTGQKCSQ